MFNVNTPRMLQELAGLTDEELHGQAEIYSQAVEEFETEQDKHTSALDARKRLVIEVMILKQKAIYYADVRHASLTGIGIQKPVPTSPKFKKKQERDYALAA